MPVLFSFTFWVTKQERTLHRVEAYEMENKTFKLRSSQIRTQLLDEDESTDQEYVIWRKIDRTVDVAGSCWDE